MIGGSRRAGAVGTVQQYQDVYDWRVRTLISELTGG